MKGIVSQSASALMTSRLFSLAAQVELFLKKVPYWYRFTWFLGRPPDLTAHQWKVLGLVAAVSFFEQYDIYLFSLNLKQIQVELQMPESELGFLGAVVPGTT